MAYEQPALPPGLAGYQAAVQGNQQQSLGQLQQMQAVMGLQGAIQQQNQAQGYRQAIAGLPADASGEQTMRAVAPFVAPDKLADINARNQDRSETRKQAALQYAENLDLKQQELDRRKAEGEQRITDAGQRAQFDQWYKAESLKLQQQNAGLNAELKRMGIDIQRERADRSAEAATNKQAQQLGTAVERAGLTTSHAVLKDAETALEKSPRLAEYLTGANSKIPDILIGKADPSISKAEADGIREGKLAFSKLFNITLKDRSGSAVTNQELDRLKAEFASGVFNTPDQLKVAVQRAKDIITNHYRGIAAGYGPAALNAYNQNLRETGGTPILEPGQAKPAVAPGAPPAPVGQIREGQTATGPNNQKIIFRGGQWQPVQ